MRFIDTHCHVHFQAYKQDMDEVITRSLNEGVFMITVGTQSTTSKNGLAVAEKYDGVWTTIGLHPNHTCEQEFYDEEELPPEGKPTGKIKTRCEEFDPDYYRELAKDPKVVAIGECGLDFYRIPDHLDRNEVMGKQELEVRKQFDLADELNLPLVIHCRDAHEQQQAILCEYVEAGKLQRRGVAHCFTGTRDEAQGYFDLGFLISFTGVITFPPRKGDPSTTARPDDSGRSGRGSGHGELSSLQRVVQEAPLDRIMIETDAPYLTPVPYRGERNEPRYVKHIAEKISELKSLPLEEVAEVTFQNAVKLFGLNVR